VHLKESSESFFGEYVGLVCGNLGRVCCNVRMLPRLVRRCCTYTGGVLKESNLGFFGRNVGLYMKKRRMYVEKRRMYVEERSRYVAERRRYVEKRGAEGMWKRDVCM